MLLVLSIVNLLLEATFAFPLGIINGSLTDPSDPSADYIDAVLSKQIKFLTTSYIDLQIIQASVQSHKDIGTLDPTTRFYIHAYSPEKKTLVTSSSVDRKSPQDWGQVHLEYYKPSDPWAPVDPPGYLWPQRPKLTMLQAISALQSEHHIPSPPWTFGSLAFQYSMSERRPLGVRWIFSAQTAEVGQVDYVVLDAKGFEIVAMEVRDGIRVGANGAAVSTFRNATAIEAIA